MTSTTDATGIVGTPMNRVEGIEKVTGHATYTADVVVPETTYAVLVQSEIPHGTVTADSLRPRPAPSLAPPA